MFVIIWPTDRSVDYKQSRMALFVTRLRQEAGEQAGDLTREPEMHRRCRYYHCRQLSALATLREPNLRGVP